MDRIGALLLFDLDGFKQINDFWGHAAGDACLVAFGKRVRQAFPLAHLIARIGGDEFAVLLPHMGSREEMQAAIAPLIGSLCTPVAWTTEMLSFRLSVGLAHASGVKPQDLFVTADKALYDAKKYANTSMISA